LNIGILQIRRLNLWYTFYELGTWMVQLASFEAVCEKLFCNRVNSWSAAEKQPRMNFWKLYWHLKWD
jgi:hypothetical protein